MMALTFIPNRSVTLVTSDFRVLTATATKDSPNWPKIEAAIKVRDERSLIEAISLKESIRTFGSAVKGRGDITIKNDNIFYRGEKLYGEDVNRILSYLAGGFPEESMILFLESKLLNPSFDSVASLYMFLENKGMPITDNGTVLGYKGVGDDYFSKNTGSEPLVEGIRNERGAVRNKVGDVIHMNRRYVCADNNQGCAGGLHIGSKNYATSWAGQGGRVMVVEFSPEHVVSVPTTEHEKLRVCKYRVVGEFNGDLLGDVYNSDFVRPNDGVDPDTVEIEGEKDWSNLYNISDWTRGNQVGLKDGKAHQKRKFYEEDKGRSFKKYSKEWVNGYLKGYREGRN
jgi:hypothetical protein